jgi:Holliday junction resolvase RusA-like endonuclease
MGRQITFTVYGEPRPKLRAKMGRGRMYNPQANKDAAQAIDYYCREQMHINGNGDFNHNIQPKPMIGPLYAITTYYLNRAKSQRERLPIKKPDVDNLEKMVFDALEGTLYKNDSQIVLSVAFKDWATDGEERTEIAIGELCGTDAPILYKMLVEPIRAATEALDV